MQTLNFKKGDIVPNWLLIRSEKVLCVFTADCTVTKPKGITGHVHIKWKAEDSEGVFKIANNKGEKIDSPWIFHLTRTGKTKPKIDKRMVETFFKDYRYFKRTKLEMMIQ